MWSAVAGNIDISSSQLSLSCATFQHYENIS